MGMFPEDRFLLSFSGDSKREGSLPAQSIQILLQTFTPKMVGVEGE